MQRTNQKLRTRTSLVEAARRLIAEGKTPNVEDAAEAAGISRTTAYRYFKNQAELLADLHPELTRTSLLPPNPPRDVEERLDLVVRELTKRVLANEAQYRTMLRLSLEGTRPPETLLLRQGRAIGWIGDAIAPVRKEIGKARFYRLVLAIRASIGIEALVWLTDIAALSREEAVKNMRWSARALLRSARYEGSR